MARPRKTLQYEKILSPMSVADLKTLRTETMVEIRLKERAIQREKSEKEALKVRDKLRIGCKVSFKQRSSSGGTTKAQVVGIFADKVQIEVGGRKRSVALTRVTSVE